MLNEIKKDAQNRMNKSVEAFRHDLTKLRTGRATTALVDHLKVNYYGSDMPLTQVATVSVSDARSLTITPWEKGMVAAVEKAILASDLGLTPNTAGTVIRINLPPLTEERRKELSKHVHAEGENAKVAIRNVRRDAIQQVKELLKDKQVTEDDVRRSEDEIQKLTDKAVKDVDDVVKAKEQELMAV
ncbi:ribosome recycling factor [Arenimonas caeni]|jgi:ribosome recycling factor|uniref:Ribosome-recycling factor n=1 Tax=Arenimonas caeni TaxID=2058085 RepID=A0A2P6M9U4_9GAMM|nr:ribosome recycling factor [Arenimonas caeni]MDY0021506.1 ribosome recycling factor [Arenimonas caeni]PRH82748.1 ribosome recycling factor [Arenimonas caeni]